MNKVVNKILFILVLFVFSACSNNGEDTEKTEKHVAKNVIFMIGDGMALPQVYSAMIASDRDLAFAHFPYTGIVTTNSANKDITDSAAGGTALACGVKTNNAMVGMNPDTIPVPSILDVMHDNGKSTGFVVTTYVTHATPASFYAKVPQRLLYEDIAEQMIHCDKLDVAIGGGRKHFNQREDGRDLLSEMMELGWTVYDTITDIDINCRHYALLANEDQMPKKADRGSFLPEALNAAIATLNQDEDGFFLMVEGSQVDYGAHANDSAWLVSETVDFSDAVNVALDFAEADGNTLVVVTADHETGGLTMIDPQGKYTNVSLRFSTSSHSCLPVIVYAYGPDAELFTGWMDNTDLAGKMFKATGIKQENK